MAEDKKNETIRYLEAHVRLPKENQSRESIIEMALMALAHIDEEWAVKALRIYVDQNPDDEFGKMALDECLMWNE